LRELHVAFRGSLLDAPAVGVDGVDLVSEVLDQAISVGHPSSLPLRLRNPLLIGISPVASASLLHIPHRVFVAAPVRLAAYKIDRAIAIRMAAAPRVQNARWHQAPSGMLNVLELWRSEERWIARIEGAAREISPPQFPV